MITIDNWNYTFYSCEDRKAFISLGGDLGEDDKSIDISYLVTVTDTQGNDIFQKSFTELGLACQDINSRYQDWTLVDSRLAPSGGGCGDCEAH